MLRAIASGFVGACTLTLAHQLIKHKLPDAPRLDRLGMQSLDKVLGAVGINLDENALLKSSLAGDILLNTLYFAQVGDNKGFGAMAKGLTLGLTMGSGAVAIPAAVALDQKTTSKTPTTVALTLALYGLGGLSAGLAAQLMGKKK